MLSYFHSSICPAKGSEEEAAERAGHLGLAFTRISEGSFIRSPQLSGKMYVQSVPPSNEDPEIENARRTQAPEELLPVRVRDTRLPEPGV